MHNTDFFGCSSTTATHLSECILRHFRSSAGNASESRLDHEIRNHHPRISCLFSPLSPYHLAHQASPRAPPNCIEPAEALWANSHARTPTCLQFVHCKPCKTRTPPIGNATPNWKLIFESARCEPRPPQSLSPSSPILHTPHSSRPDVGVAGVAAHMASTETRHPSRRRGTKSALGDTMQIVQAMWTSEHQNILALLFWQD